ncbi:hypothetical protein TCAL_15694, partial [Tigriopus californicus]
TSTASTKFTFLPKDIYESKENFLVSTPGSVYVPKYAPWGAKISEVQGRLISSGIVDKIAKKYVGRKEVLEDKLVPLSLEHILSPLFLLASGLCLSMLVLISELHPWRSMQTAVTKNYK